MRKCVCVHMHAVDMHTVLSKCKCIYYIVSHRLEAVIILILRTVVCKKLKIQTRFGPKGVKLVVNTHYLA